MIKRSSAILILLYISLKLIFISSLELTIHAIAVVVTNFNLVGLNSNFGKVSLISVKTASMVRPLFLKNVDKSAIEAKLRVI